MPLFDSGSAFGRLYGAGGRLCRGLSSGPGAGGGGMVSGVPNENGVYLPEVDSHWQSLGLSPWGSTWGMQEPTGSAVGSGSAGFTLAPNGSPLYQRPVPGWTRVAISELSGTSQGMTAASGTGPDITVTPTAWLAYFRIRTPSVGRHVLGLLNVPLISQYTYLQQNNGTVSIFAAGGQTNGALQYNHDDGFVHPVLLVCSGGTGGGASLFTDQDKAVRTFTTKLSEGPKGIGMHTSAPIVDCVYLAQCTGALAFSLLASGTARSFLQTLGWSIAWT